MSIHVSEGASGERAPVDARKGSLRGAGAEKGFTAAFELVMTPAAFALIGYFIDRQLGTGRIFTIGLAAFVAAYLVWKLIYQYNTQMDELQAELRDPSGPEGRVTE